MANLFLEQQTVTTREGETVLDACLRQGISMPFSCRDGACHACKQVAVTGDIPADAQRGLSDAEKEVGCFLPCVCVPSSDMRIAPPNSVKLFTKTLVQGKQALDGGGWRVLLEPTLAEACETGQELNLRLGNGETCRRAIVNQPAEDYFLAVDIPASDVRFAAWAAQAEVEAELEIQGPYAATPANNTEKAKYPPPDPVLWAALQDGKLMMEVLADFYGRVYQDPLLAPYFHGATMRRSIEKVYSFMRQVCTGDDVFFGDRPRNAHHWMVISDEIYQHRENLMRECQRRAGLAPEMTERWMAIENYYRDDIVKSEPWKRTFAGVELPVDGFGEMVLDEGSICDGCGQEVTAGETVRYHLRMGTLYCPRCNDRQ